MKECVINPSRRKQEPCLPSIGILAVNPSDTVILPELAKTYNLQRHFLFHSNLYTSQRFFIAGPAVGAPMGAMCLEKLIALGARCIIVHGWCGAISSALSVGDVFLPTSGISSEGTSIHYCPDNIYAPDPLLTSVIKSRLGDVGWESINGAIWTTDALYREKRQYLETLRQQQVMAVDMEYTGLVSVAAFRKVALCAVMMVSDELYHEKWKEGVSNKLFRKKSKKMLRILCEQVSSEKMGMK